jgi:hypothetical protein
MEAEFFHVSTEARRFSLDASVGLHDLKGALKRWERELRRVDTHSLALFYDCHDLEMNRVALTLRGIKDPQITGYHDRIFTKLFGVSRRIPTNLTRVFQDFIKGITYFKHQTTVEVPVYHRLLACGPGDDAFRKLFQQCEPDMDRDRRNDVRKRIETCYVERLLYDAMYRHATLHFARTGTEDHQQDAAHQLRLVLTQSDFKTCFPNLDIKVDVEFETHWPVSVRICRYVRSDLVSVETYQKHIAFSTGAKRYEDVVYARRVTKQNAYVKNQSFEYATNWKRLNASTTAETLRESAQRLHRLA